MTLKQENEYLKKELAKWQDRKLWEDIKMYQYLKDNLQLNIKSDSGRVEVELILRDPISGEPNAITQDSTYI